MTFTNESQHLMKYFFNELELFSGKKKKSNKFLKTLYKRYHHAIILYNKKYKYVIKKTIVDKYVDSDLMKGKYMDERCRDEIRMSKGVLKVKVNIEGVTINLELMIFNNKDYNNLGKYDSYIEKSITFLIFLFSFIKNKKPSSITYYLYLTKYKKQLPSNRREILCGTNCNTGVTYGCTVNGRVLIYREEEWFKVLIHETFHMLCLDFNNMYLDNFNNEVRKMININSEYNLFESYTEFWATYLNSVYCATKLTGNIRNDKDFMLYFDFCINYERVFSLFQCVKVLNHMGLLYENLVSNEEISKSLKNLHYKENTNVFAYYIIKTVILYFEDEFILWCKKNNSDVLNFTKNNESLHNFLSFIKKKINNVNLKKSIKIMEKISKKLKGQVIKKSLRMTIININ